MMPTPQPGDAPDALKCELAAETLRAFGRLRLRVNGWSMFPALRPGDTLHIERTRNCSVLEGEIVLFVRNGRCFVHRIVKKQDGNTALTRGDAMPHADLPVAEAELLGKVRWIERRGKRMQAERNRRPAERALSALLRRSELATRVVVRAHGVLSRPVEIPPHRVVPCQN